MLQSGAMETHMPKSRVGCNSLYKEWAEKKAGRDPEGDGIKVRLTHEQVKMNNDRLNDREGHVFSVGEIIRLKGRQASRNIQEFASIGGALNCKVAMCAFENMEFHVNILPQEEMPMN